MTWAELKDFAEEHGLEDDMVIRLSAYPPDEGGVIEERELYTDDLTINLEGEDGHMELIIQGDEI